MQRFFARCLIVRAAQRFAINRDGIVNLFVKSRILMSYKEKSSGRAMRSGEVCVVMRPA
jgi:hypothetical protein